ncbi:MAG: type II toxin-antitoxin system Phd/YefM family antitoxin [Ardenticatenaceae bacterium]|nr:type II toxin-antitoxin system Phd/YefM family antitoxin [Ardenticatenaceae bacterium]
MRTKIMPVTDFRRMTSAIIRDIQEEGDVVYITQHGRPTAVMLEYKAYERLLALAEQQETWPEAYFAQTYGAMADDPLTRSEPIEIEERESMT